MEYAGCSAGIGYALLLFRTDSIRAYAIGVTRQRLSGRHPLVNPTLITIGIVAAALIGFFAGSLTAILSSLAVGWLLGLSHTELLSLAPKSATAAVSMEIAAKNGGTPAVTAVLTILTGVRGQSSLLSY